MEAKAWNWSAMDADRWSTPSEEAYYLLHRWKELGFTRFLDVGCGRGRHALFFARHGFSVTACDLSVEGIGMACELAHEAGLKMDIDHADCRKLPYDDESMDCAMAYHVIFHSDGPGTRQALDEIRRVLRPGGEAYVTFLSVAGDSFQDPSHERIDDYTVRKTTGFEAGIPHHYMDRTGILHLLASWDMISVRHIEEIFKDGISAHYFVLIRKTE